MATACSPCADGMVHCLPVSRELAAGSASEGGIARVVWLPFILDQVIYVQKSLGTGQGSKFNLGDKGKE